MLFQVWICTPRPTHWNKKRFRTISNGTAVDIDRCSVDGYQEHVVRPARIDMLQCLFRLCCLAMLLGIWAVPLIVIVFTTKQGSLHVGFVAVCCCFGISMFFAIMFLAHLPFSALRPSKWRTYGAQASVGKSRISDTSSSLRGLLQALRDRKAREHKDLSFAMYGVLQSLDVELRKPHYSEPLGSVYKNLFTSLVKWNPALINLLVDVGATLPGTPSWVPDWSTVRERKWLDPNYVYDALDQVGIRPLDDRLVLTDDQLILSGTKLATVTSVFPVFKQISAGRDTLGVESQEHSLSPALRSAIEALAYWIALLRKDVPFNREYDSVTRTVHDILYGRASGDTELHHMAFSECFRSLVKHASASYPLDPRTSSLPQPRVQAVYDELRQKGQALGTLATLVNMMVKSKRVVFMANEHACSVRIKWPKGTSC